MDETNLNEAYATWIERRDDVRRLFDEFDEETDWIPADWNSASQKLQDATTAMVIAFEAWKAAVAANFASH